MKDVIQDAKQLLEGTTPGPWRWEHRPFSGDFKCDHDWLGSDHGTALETADSDGHASWVEASDSDKALIAAAPENTQALAEETWQYGVRYIGINHGEHHIEWVEPTGDAEVDKDILQRIVKSCEKWGQLPKVVRRRISPVEVIG